MNSSEIIPANFIPISFLSSKYVKSLDHILNIIKCPFKCFLDVSSKQHIYGFSPVCILNHNHILFQMLFSLQTSYVYGFSPVCMLNPNHILFQMLFSLGMIQANFIFIWFLSSMYIKSHYHNNYVESYALLNVAFSGNLFRKLIWFLSSMYIKSHYHNNCVESYALSNVAFSGNLFHKLHTCRVSLQYV